MVVWVVTITEHYPCKETFEFMSSNRQKFELSVTGAVRKHDTRILGITVKDTDAKLLIENKRKELIEQYGEKILEESPDPNHRFFTFGVELKDVKE